MRYGLFAIYDAQVKTFMRPFFAMTVGQAERSFGDGVRHPDSDYGKHPHDYSMFKLGEFDDESGLLYSEQAPVHCCNAIGMLPADHPSLQNVTRVVENPNVPIERAAFNERLRAFKKEG